MGLFKHEDKQQDSTISDMGDSVYAFDRRIAYIEKSAEDSANAISLRDAEMDSYYSAVRQQIEAIREESENIKKELQDADLMLKQMVRNMRLIAQKKELSELNEMMKAMKIESLVTEKEFRSMISETTKQ